MPPARIIYCYEGCHLYLLVGILLKGDPASFFPIHLFSRSFISVCTPGFLFLFSGFSQILSFYFIFILVCTVPRLSQWEPLQGGSPVFLTCLHFLSVLYFLVQQDVPGSSCSFPVSALASSISPRSPHFFSQR